MKFKVRGIDTFASTGGRPFDKNKPLIIFVHGSGLSHMVWVLQTRYFAFRGYSVLAVDLPGHGLSSGESLKTIEEMGNWVCLLYTSPSPRDGLLSRMPSSA